MVEQEPVIETFGSPIEVMSKALPGNGLRMMILR
jgi:hypothetical protein